MQKKLIPDVIDNKQKTYCFIALRNYEYSLCSPYLKSNGRLYSKWSRNTKAFARLTLLYHVLIKSNIPIDHVRNLVYKSIV